MKRSLLFGIPLLAAVGAVVLFLWTEQSAAPPRPVPHFGSAGMQDEPILREHPSDRSRVDATPRSKEVESNVQSQEGQADDPVQHPRGPSASSLHVLVVDDHHLPIDAAQVLVFRRPWAEARSRGEADRDGRVEINALPGDELRVRAESLVQRSVVVPERPWPTPLEVSLSTGVLRLAGRVIDDLGSPVPDALIELSDGTRSIAASTNEAGQFEVRLGKDAPALRQVEIWLRAPGHVFLGNGGVTTLPEASADGWEITMHRSARVTVHVVDSGGRVVPTARAWLLGPPENGRRDLLPGLGSAVHAARCGDDLCFEIVPPLTPLWISVEEASLGRREVHVGELTPGTSRELRVDFTAAWNARAWHFLATDGSTPVTSGRVVVSSDGGSAAWVEIASDGTFTIDPPSERFALEVQVPGFDVEQRSLTTTEPSDGPVEIVLTPSTNVVRAHVADDRGVPQPGILVRIEQAGIGGMKLALRTDEHGYIEYRGVASDVPLLVRIGDGQPGMYLPAHDDRTLVSSPAAYRGVRANGPVLEFTLVPPASVAGRIEGEALEGARVSLSCFETIDAPLPPVFSVAAPLSSEGAFYFTGLPPGRYHLWSNATARGNTIDRPLATIDLHAGQDLREVRVRP